ncbi:putative late blight resistance protein homolog R1B-17 [Salvia splendens]|uniref:putative late blight resistance protein homolog R1B-17 n=1 Tax=Salvia splendens TaxID=180675 RepID=UPI001C2746FB|nr:putative late blight resistance protein homolog R1B-17 [Salvia splendens]XP_042011548.1 putative late blight resistance protein homolog R1B-17 [Salvia splendens]XP_042011549.1 putative late blight resistance protein homolog R1B-17 [Salvia splendens]
MAAFGAAASLKITIEKLFESRILLVAPYPIVEQFIASYCAVFDHSYFKVVIASYAAAVSLNYTVLSILQSFRVPLVSVFHISVFTRVMLTYVAALFLKYKMSRFLPRAIATKFIVPVMAYNAMHRLQIVLLKLEETGFRKVRTKVNALDERIKEIIWEFEDSLESQFTNQILPQLESSSSGGVRDPLPYSVNLWSLKESVDCFVKRMKVMEAEYVSELLTMPEEESEPISSRIDFGGINSVMVGSSDVFERVRDFLIEDEGKRILVTGMAGVGKTTIAKKVSEDPLIKKHFELRVWVEVGRICQSTEIVQCILAQEDPNTYNQVFTQGDDDEEKLVGLLKERLMYKKCLIVLDDVWEWDTQLMDILPEENVRILVTSRIRLDECPIYSLVCLLNEDESNKLLGEKVFGEEGFPPHLKKLGEKIAKKCEGLPLMLVTVAELLSKEDKTEEYWTEVAQKQHNSVFMDSYNQISEVLFPSYDYLPQYLKMIFLYMGAFPPYSNIDEDNIVYLLIAEGFLEPSEEITLSNSLGECTMTLIDKYNLVLLDAEPYVSWFSTKDFRVHSCWQHVCKKEASKIKFLHVLQSWDDVIKDQRRLCAHCNTLFSFKQVYDSIKSDCSPIARSLLCLGPYVQYPVPIHDMDLKLLRVLNAANVRFYLISQEIMKLVCLRYLSLTCNLEITVSISNLLHLQSLMIKPHMNIRKFGVVSYMPDEIWDMQELLNLEVTGRDLPTPNSDATLEKIILYFWCECKELHQRNSQKIP